MSPARSFTNHFKRHLNLKYSLDYLLGLFCKSLLTGERFEELNMFEPFSSITEDCKIQYPLCYIGLIAARLGDESFQRIIDKITVYSQSSESGKGWDEIIHLGFYIQARCLNLCYYGFGPLQIRKKPASSAQSPFSEELYNFADIVYPEEVTNEQLALEEMIKHENVLRSQGFENWICLYLPTSSSFSAYDGFVTLNDSRGIVRFGYQAKQGVNPPIPMEGIHFDKSFYISGFALKTARNIGSVRIKLTRDEVMEELGFSLRSLCPIMWPGGEQANPFSPPPPLPCILPSSPLIAEQIE